MEFTKINVPKSTSITTAINTNITSSSSTTADPLWENGTGDNSLIPVNSFNSAAGDNSVAIGSNTKTTNEGELSIGLYNKSTLDLTLFSIGNGDNATRNNALEVTKDGTIIATKFKGYLQGNSDTSTILLTARNIWGLSFDGSSDITGLLIANAGINTTYLNASSTGYFGGALTANSTLNVNGNSTFAGLVGIGTAPQSGYSLVTDGNALVGNDLSVSGGINGASTLYVAGESTIDNNLSVKGDLTLTGKITAPTGLITDLTVDTLTVEKEAHFFKLIIDEIKAAGGLLVLSAADMTVDKVVSITGGYRCYLRCKSESGSEISNKWKVNDQALCQTFNVTTGTSYNVSNKYYWALVIGTGYETVDNIAYFYIDLSSTTVDGTLNPEQYDNICLLGFRGTDDSARLSAIIISAYKSPDPNVTAPSIVQYKSISTFSFSDKIMNLFASSGNIIKGNLYVESGDNVSALLTTLSTTTGGLVTKVAQITGNNVLTGSGTANGWNGYSSYATDVNAFIMSSSKSLYSPIIECGADSYVLSFYASNTNFTVKIYAWTDDTTKAIISNTYLLDTYTSSDLNVDTTNTLSYATRYYTPLTLSGKAYIQVVFTTTTDDVLYKIQLEEGLTLSAYNKGQAILDSQIKLTADSISLKVEEGTSANLLTGTRTGYDWKLNTNNHLSTGCTLSFDNSVFTLINPANNAASLFSPFTTLTKGCTYTLSFDVKTLNGSSTYDYYIFSYPVAATVDTYDSGYTILKQVISQASTTGYMTVSTTFTCSTENVILLRIDCSTADTLYIKDVTIEKGSISTGIDIKNKTVDITADTFKVSSTDGKQYAVFEEDASGIPHLKVEDVDINGVLNEQFTVIERADNFAVIDLANANLNERKCSVTVRRNFITYDSNGNVANCGTTDTPFILCLPAYDSYTNTSYTGLSNTAGTIIGTSKGDYTVSPYTKGGTNISILNEFNPDVSNWKNFKNVAAHYTGTSSESILRDTLNNSALLVCADPRLLSYHNYLNDTPYYIPDGLMRDCNLDYCSGVFCMNGALARFVMLLPGQELKLKTNIETFIANPNGANKLVHTFLVYYIENAEAYLISQKKMTIQNIDNSYEYTTTFISPFTSSEALEMNDHWADTIFTTPELNGMITNSTDFTNYEPTLYILVSATANPILTLA